MGRFCRTLDIIDSHTCGQATRTVVSGVPRLEGNSMMEKMLFFEKHCAWVKTVLTSEPRGNKLTSVAVLTEPTIPGADAGAFYFEAHGYMPLCGHDTIGLCTMLAETGRIRVEEPITMMKLETPAGLLDVKIEIRDGRVLSVAFENAPCFAYGWDYKIDYRGKKIPVGIAYGGNNYAIVPAKELGFEICPKNRRALVEAGIELLEKIDQKYGKEIVHPENPLICGVSHMMLAGEVEAEGQILKSRNCVCTELDSFDRSPCGTGTSARTALLYAQGLMKPGMILSHESIIGSLFESRITRETWVGGYRAVTPEIKGSAHLTGFAKLIVDPDDKLGLGFEL